HNRAGYWRIEDGKKLYLFNNPALKEAAQGYGLKRIIQTLEVIGALPMKGADRPQKLFRFPFGGADRFIVIDPEKLE
ncbi:MAG: RNA helicase, partial [Pseudomonadales bacterium]|nr:RNA helicase [Pseudomonadales bacterium]